jgi:hypothetical protein
MLHVSGVLEVAELVARIKAEQGLEGCVLKLEDIHCWHKIKSDWYFAQSRSHLKLPNGERQLWASILAGTTGSPRFEGTPPPPPTTTNQPSNQPTN